jgi:enamine deaminase RidA (YjgF/YER057c/UK114 family)
MKRSGLTKQAPHPWSFSHGVVVEGSARLVFLAGQVAFDRHGPDRQLVGVGDPAAQTRQAIENIRTLLRQAGGDLQHVVEMTVYATSAELMEPAGRVAQTYFTDPPTGAVVHCGEGARPPGAPRGDPRDRSDSPAARPAAGRARDRAAGTPPAHLTGSTA